jgi:hypothetical protein
MATKTDLITEINTNFPDNTDGDITPEILRTTTIDEVNSWQQAPQVNKQSASYPITADDYGQLVAVNAPAGASVSLPDVFPFNVLVKNEGSNSLLVEPPAGTTIDGGVSVALGQGESAWVISDGSNWHTGILSVAGTGGGGGGGGGGGTTTLAALGAPMFATPADAQAAVIPDAVVNLGVMGNKIPSDGGASNYKRVASLPPAYVGDGPSGQLIPPSFTSGGVPVLCFATTYDTVANRSYVFRIDQPILAGCFTFCVVFWTPFPYPANITDSAGNVYTLAFAYGGSGTVGAFAIYTNSNPVFAPIGTVFTLAGFDPAVAGQQPQMNIYCCPTFKGAVLDQTNAVYSPVTTSGGASVTSPSLTGSPEFVIGLVWTQQTFVVNPGVPGLAYTVPPGWIDLQPPINGKDPIACVVTNSMDPVTFNPTWTVGDAPTGTWAAVLTFKTFPTSTIDASFWQLIPSLPLHTAQFGIDPIASDNAVPFQNFSKYLSTIAAPSGGIGAERAGTPNTGTVAISIASPAVITVTMPPQFPGNHGLRNGQAISFQTTGALPTGIVVNQIYYVLYGTVTPTTFQITSTPLFNGSTATSVKGTPIATSGTQSGTHSYTTYGESWTDFVWDPGNYAASGNMAPGINCGLKRTRALAYGTRIATNINLYGGADRDQNANTPASGGPSLWCYHTQFQTTDVNTSGHQQDNVTLITPAQAVNFYVNSWVALMAIDMQQDAGANWNPSTFEFLKVKSVDAIGGVITFYDRLQYNYRSTYPKFTPGTGVGWSGSADGPGTIVQLNDGFDQELEVHGLNIYGVTEGTIGGMRTVRLIDCEMYGWAFDSGPSPALVRKFTMERCNFHNCIPEVDKMIDTIEYIDCVFDQTSYPRLQTASINKLLIERCKMMNGVSGTAKETVIKDSFLSGQFKLGIVYGATDRVTLINSYIGETLDSMQEGTVVNTVFVTFTNGTLSIPIGGTTAYGTWRAPGGATAAVCPLPWAVPGAKIALCATPTVITNASTSGTINPGSTMGMIKAFTVLDVYTDGAGAFSVDTDLPVFPNTAITLTGTVSGTTLTATAVTPSDAWPLAGMNITGGTLPGGTVITQIPGVPANQLGAYTLNNSATIGASTPFTVTNVMHYQPHSCARLTVINCTGGRTVADMAGAPPDIPMYSYFRRAFAGLPISVNTSERYVRLAGNLLYLNINVLRPYTGAAASYQFNINIFGYKTAGGITYPTISSQSVNLKTVGLRQITAAGVTGNLAGDAISAVPFWLTGSHVVAVGPTLGGGDTLAMMPYVVVTAQTDQGIYPSLVLNAHDGVNQFADTVTQANALW